MLKPLRSVVQMHKKILDSAKNYNFKRIYKMQNFKESFLKATELAKPNYIVLLAPASASFDEFIDYADRGETFERFVGEVYDKTA